MVFHRKQQIDINQRPLITTATTLVLKFLEVEDFLDPFDEIANNLAILFKNLLGLDINSEG
jgi:hypothetical protein